ncbi:S-layer homology domain-containing protein [[Clostridium] colinum]|uniref:S-layer homology domain-containing protein n=1 Tax=[Clostridium] colinum TaxID=36835 RepID=UPI002024C5BA|nr:S-layer homology domain-containing protein [[Clostridium] colinum]
MIKKLLSSILITLMFVTNVFATNTTVSINVDNKVANINLDGINNNIHGLQLNIIDENGNTNVKFEPAQNFTYSLIKEKENNGKTTISIVIDNGGILTENNSLNLGKLIFNNKPNLSKNVTLELVNLNESLKGTYTDITANITVKEETSTENTTSSNNNNSNISSGGSATIGKPNDKNTESTTQASTENNNKTENNDKINIDTMYPVIKQSNFSDTSGHWANSSIKYLADRGIINGVSETSFKPNDNITRAEFVTLLAKMDNINENKYKSENFTDVSSTAWFNPYVDWAYKVGITNGTTNTTFAPNAKITREQMAVMIEKFCEYKKFDLKNNKEEISFTDINNISSFAKSSVTRVQQAGIINGRPDGSFAPKSNATRAEAAQMIYTMLTIQ